MFTGIVTDVGTVSSAEQRGDLRLRSPPAFDMAPIDLGASIACSGVCLTVVDKGSRLVRGRRLGAKRFRARPPTSGGRARSSTLNARSGSATSLAGTSSPATSMRLEPSSSADPKAIRFGSRSQRPRALGAMIAPKGSVALDGVSLTVNTVEDAGGSTRFSINVIPHTASATTLGNLRPGQQLNVEVDVLARYIDRMLAARSTVATSLFLLFITSKCDMRHP